MNTMTAQQVQPQMLLAEQTAMPLVQAQSAAAQIASQTVVTPADLIRLAMESGDKDIERLERLMAMDERYRESQERERKRAAELAFYDDFASFTKLGIVIPKTKLVKQRAKGGGQGPTFWQTEYDHVCALLKPALGQLGFGVHHEPIIKRNGKAVDWVDVTCTITHKLGHSRSITLGGPPDDSGSKNPGQEIQSTITYWSRHTLLAATSTAQEGKDNDGRGARGYREEGGHDEDDAPTDDPLDAARSAGNAAAQVGTTALNTWWAALTAKQRNALQNDFTGMRKTAREAEQKAGAA